MNSKTSKNTEIVGVRIQHRQTLFVSRPIGQTCKGAWGSSIIFISSTRWSSKAHFVLGRSMFSPLRRFSSCSFNQSGDPRFVKPGASEAFFIIGHCVPRLDASKLIDIIVFDGKTVSLSFLHLLKRLRLRQVKAWVERLKRPPTEKAKIFLMTQKNPEKGFHKHIIRYISLKQFWKIHLKQHVTFLGPWRHKIFFLKRRKAVKLQAKKTCHQIVSQTVWIVNWPCWVDKSIFIKSN